MDEKSQFSLKQLKGVGPKTIENLSRLDIRNCQDLLFHLPLRYEDRTRVTPISVIRQGDRVLIQGVIQSAQRVFGRRRSLVVTVSDDTGVMTLRFFYFSKAQADKLSVIGETVVCFGEARKQYRKGWEMVHPEYQFNDGSIELEDRLTAIYPTTKGLQQRMIRRLIKEAMDLVNEANMLPERLPVELFPIAQKISLMDALQFLHQPPCDVKLATLLEGNHPAQARLIFEELMAHQISLILQRQLVRKHLSFQVRPHGKLADAVEAQFPFDLTPAQARVIDEIRLDLIKASPMMRLLQGDVGSGKTIVAAITIADVVESGYQAAVMAPTELLAEQHCQAFRAWFETLGVSVGWLSGEMTPKEKNIAQEKIASGEYQIVIGTHALFQKNVQFHQLAYAVIDEQHRFGVKQRLLLQEKGMEGGGYPHQLVMTATPIPRTLAMTAYGDMDCSVIDTLPPGRQPIDTLVLSNEKRDAVIRRVRENCLEGRQVYWVCTLIDESEALQCQAAEVTAAELQQALQEVRVGLVHGRLKADEKASIMTAFKAHELDLLVATTVIEVGVDVPNASLMIIDNAERLGLAQLHQLRGRVGRGTLKSHCVLMYKGPLSKHANRRLASMRATQDGFKLAEEDLKLRGPGEVLGTRQTGLMSFKVADLLRDSHLLNQAKQAAKKMVSEDPENAVALVLRWLGKKVECGKV